MNSRALKAPTLSIVLEWETGGEVGGGRGERCLRALADEALTLQAPPELVLVCDSGSAPETLDWPGPLQVAQPANPLGYYEKKNFGFARSSGEIVIFVDSDLIVEPGWLEAIVEPMADPRISAVVGRTHFDTDTLYARAVALFWIFDARENAALLRPTPRLVSNNIAFRRPLFAALPFPERTTYRGQCSELGARMARLGIVLWEATAARAAHPPARGLGGFLARAFHAGRDACFYAALERDVTIADCRAEWRKDRAAIRARIAERAPLIGAGPLDRACALLLGEVYYATKALAFFSRLRRAGSRPMAPQAAPS